MEKKREAKSSVFTMALLGQLKQETGVFVRLHTTFSPLFFYFSFLKLPDSLMEKLNLSRTLTECSSINKYRPRIHTYIHTYFIGSSPRGFSESILHYILYG